MGSHFKVFFLPIPALLHQLRAKFGLVETEILSAQINSELPTIFHLVSVSLSLALASFFVCKFAGSRFPLTAQVLEPVGIYAVCGDRVHHGRHNPISVLAQSNHLGYLPHFLGPRFPLQLLLL
ncbi:hypothetical protein TIFTF001_027128 [Ficus carica]|uniref:Uncharacterized protein n=1 Tax=Ficus carica TaxID=3494 RepID=A0AA88DMF2_FICCA|nr:hypothetical protein TIFTF001_027128 [Ficus carica]